MSSITPAIERSRWNPKNSVIKSPVNQLGLLRYSLLGVGVLAQLVTVLMTWPLWQIRSHGMPNLPAFNVPELSFGVIVVLSTMVVLLIPKWGIWINLAVLIVATFFDQMRAQPQFLANWILMFAAIVPVGSHAVRLFLVSLWFWAGLHKFMSPDWFTHKSWGLVQQAGLDAKSMYLGFAYMVASSELLLGLLAWFRPRWAAVGCPLLHIGIVIFLSPLFGDWNYSVFPWNLATAIVGCWVLIDVAAGPKARLWEYWLLLILMIVPAGFYVGWVDHGYAHVLYSGNVPRATVTKLDGHHFEVEAWGELAVPFPNERRLLKQYFAETADVGEKLHIFEPRMAQADQYFVMTDNGPTQVDIREFYDSANGTPMGIGTESRRSILSLSLAGARILKRDERSAIYAVEILPETFTSNLMKAIAGLPNLEELQLSGTSVTDNDLRSLVELRRIEGIGLNETAITSRGIQILKKIPSLKSIHSDQDSE